MPRKGGFPQISSMPSIRRQTSSGSFNPSEDIPLRSIEAKDIRDLPLTSSPYLKRFKNNSTIWSPISISSVGSSDEDETRDKIGDLSHPMTVPVSLEKQRSMLCLKSARDQKYQGVRALKPARIVNKAGDRNIEAINLPEKSARFAKDIVHTLIEAQWRWVLAAFVLVYFISWYFFAVLFYLIGWAHGDLQFDEETGQRLGEGREECVRGAVDMTGFFLLSVESQVSTGYGEKYPTEECPEAIFLLIVQLVIGVAIDAAMVGIVYVKAIRPPKYADFKFSRYAVICQRDGKLCLVFRVADFEQSHSIDTKLRAYLFEEKITAEGERSGKIQQRLKLENNGRVFLIMPQTVCHYIDKDSPFYDMSAKDLLERRFEIILSLTGVSRHTGQPTQARTSYLSREVLWGNRFANAITYDHDKGHYVTHVEKLDEVFQVDTPLCSAQRLDEVLAEVHDAMETNSFCINKRLEEFDEGDEDEEDDTGIQMRKLNRDESMASSTKHEKFNVTKVDENKS